MYELYVYFTINIGTFYTSYHCLILFTLNLNIVTQSSQFTFLSHTVYYKYDVYSSYFIQITLITFLTSYYCLVQANESQTI